MDIKNDKVWYLKQIDLFHGISDEEIMQIAQKVVEKKCTKKELLYTPFDTSDSICMLKKGEVTLYHSHYGKKIIIDVLKPGSIFGAIPFQENNSEHFAEVTEDAYICFFTSEDFMKVIEAKPRLMLKMLKVMSSKISEYENRMKTGLYDAKEKIIHHLEMMETKTQSLFARLIGSKSITHEKLSQLTGLSRETVTRAITALKKEGRINSSENGKIISVKTD
jgi:CRP-like cAMP-binding protein